MNQLIVATVIASTLRLATPLILAALAGVLGERSGVINIGLEGQLLLGAFAYLGGMIWTGNIVIATLMAILAGAVGALLFSWIAVSIGGDQVIVGIAINLIAMGLSAYMYRSVPIFATDSVISGIPHLKLPFGSIPYIGSAISDQSAITWLSAMLVVIIWFVIFRTRTGLRLRSAGENPTASVIAGIAVKRMRVVTLVIGGGLCGVGGAFILSEVHGFNENLVSGAGFIALAAVIIGRWNPFGAALAAVVFAAVQAVQTTFQANGINVPQQFLLMAPYVVTIVALGFFGTHRGGPKALGVALEAK